MNTVTVFPITVVKMSVINFAWPNKCDLFLKEDFYKLLCKCSKCKWKSYRLAKYFIGDDGSGENEEDNEEQEDYTNVRDQHNYNARDRHNYNARGQHNYKARDRHNYNARDRHKYNARDRHKYNVRDEESEYKESEGESDEDERDEDERGEEEFYQFAPKIYQRPERKTNKRKVKQPVAKPIKKRRRLKKME